MFYFGHAVGPPCFENDVGMAETRCATHHSRNNGVPLDITRHPSLACTTMLVGERETHTKAPLVLPRLTPPAQSSPTHYPRLCVCVPKTHTPWEISLRDPWNSVQLFPQHAHGIGPAKPTGPLTHSTCNGLSPHNTTQQWFFVLSPTTTTWGARSISCRARPANRRTSRAACPTAPQCLAGPYARSCAISSRLVGPFELLPSWCSKTRARDRMWPLRVSGVADPCGSPTCAMMHPLSYETSLPLLLMSVW